MKTHSGNPSALLTFGNSSASSSLPSKIHTYSYITFKELLKTIQQEVIERQCYMARHRTVQRKINHYRIIYKFV